jgi:hypothetical protein
LAHTHTQPEAQWGVCRAPLTPVNGMPSVLPAATRIHTTSAASRACQTQRAWVHVCMCVGPAISYCVRFAPAAIAARTMMLVPARSGCSARGRARTLADGQLAKWQPNSHSGYSLHKCAAEETQAVEGNEQRNVRRAPDLTVDVHNESGLKAATSSSSGTIANSRGATAGTSCEASNRSTCSVTAQTPSAAGDDVNHAAVHTPRV